MQRTPSSARSLSKESPAERAARVAADPWGGKRRPTTHAGKTRAERDRRAARGRVRAWD